VIFAWPGCRFDSAFNNADCYFSSSIGFTNDVSSNAVEVTSRVAAVISLYVRQPHHYTVDRFVCQILSVAESLGDKYPDQTQANGFVLLSRELSIIAKPRQ
jgi:hypothetical protein